MMAQSNERGVLEVGRVYLGDVTAICAYKRRDLCRICVGSGGAISCYDAESGRLVAKEQVFTNGFRIHGTQASTDHQHLAVYGERSLKLYSVGKGGHDECDFEAPRLVSSVGPLAHWIMDAVFLPITRRGLLRIALGLSNNTVQVFCIGKDGAEVRGTRQHYACLSECLLYSMKLFLSEEEGKVFVAAGTIFNSVLVWEFIPKEEDYDNEDDDDKPNDQEGRLCPATINFVGHEGSIHRLNWSSCGKLLASCSDDRTARVWNLKTPRTPIPAVEVKGGVKKLKSHTIEKREADEIFFGHQARLWDCLFTADSDFLVTASEDCTCKVWSLSSDEEDKTNKDGLVCTLQGGTHVRGKGVWRIATSGSSLFTAGSDNAVKKWSLAQCCNLQESSVSTSLPSTNIESATYFLPRPPWAEEQEQGASNVAALNSDSKITKEDREWVRCLKLVNHRTMYVATNQGMLYLLPVGKKPSKWKAVYSGQRRNVMVSLEVIFAEREEKKKDKKEEEEDDSLYNHFVCAGDIYGHVSMVSVLAPDGDCENFKIGSCLEWQAHPGRRVLGIFKVRANPEADGNDAFGERQQLTLFSTDSSGEVKWWKFASGDLVAGQAQAAPLLLAKLQSPLKRRILCLDVCFASKLIVCGDQNGSVMAFKYHQGQDPTKDLELVTMLRSQHGVNAVTLMKFNDMNELISGGRDGKLFNYEIRSSPGEGSNTAPSASSLCPIGVHSVNNVAAIEDYIDLGDQMKFVAGFQSTDFVVWNIVDDCQLIHSHCGGWRRPHSFIMDKTGELTFAYLKNEMIFVHLLSQKRDQAETESKLEEAALVEVEGDSNCSVFSNALAPTFHGCEIHSTKLLQSSFLNSEERNTYFAMTGSEDGCVRYSKWHFSREENAFRLEGTGLVGEFIAGAAVRELSYCKCWNLNLGRSTNVYLTSVGAKEVVMVWNLFCGTTAKSNGKQRNLRNKCIGMKIPKGGLRPKSYATKDSIDLRHLAVDTFAVSCTEDVDVIFMLLSSADATLRLAALEYNRLSGYTKWHEEVCDLMEGGQNPTLSIAYKLFQDGENESSSSTLMDNQRVVAFTGSTDGTLCCWDLSGVVKLFMCSLGAHDDMPPQRMRVVPIAKYRGVHESGVNSLEISSIKRKDDADASSGGVCCVCVVSGGDDQAIHVKDVVLSSNQQENERSSEDANGMSTILRVISCLDAHVANAHFSSLKGVWTSGDVVASTGIDQRLNLWKIQRVGSSSSEGGKKEILQLLLKGSRCVEAGETESLDVVMHQHDDNDDDNEEAAEPLCQIALVGRGLNLICIKEESVL